MGPRPEGSPHVPFGGDAGSCPPVGIAAGTITATIPVGVDGASAAVSRGASEVEAKTGLLVTASVVSAAVHWPPLGGASTESLALVVTAITVTAVVVVVAVVLVLLAGAVVVVAAAGTALDMPR